MIFFADFIVFQLRYGRPVMGDPRLDDVRDRSLQITSTPARPRPMNFVVLAASRQPFGVGQQRIERWAVQVSAIRHHGGDAPGVADIGKRIAVEQD